MIKSIQSVKIDIALGDTVGIVGINGVLLDTSILLHLGASTPTIQIPQSLSYVMLGKVATVEAHVLTPLDTEGFQVFAMVIEFEYQFVKSKQDIDYQLPPGTSQKIFTINPVRLDRTILVSRGARYTVQQYPPHWFFRQTLISSNQHATSRYSTTGTLEVRSTVFEFK